ncbi:MAG: hypothetical protein JO322_06625 [Candidatus Eremiobacteraeota bacterium]|nr:hypothetical protein [Candidatus Eremiobacteraeota bacterium]
MIGKNAALLRLIPTMTVAALATAGGGEVRAAATDTASLLAPLKAFATAYNRGDREFPVNAYIDDAPTIDDFPPYSWRGSNAARIWYQATIGGNTTAAYKEFLDEHQVLELGRTLTVRQHGDHAFVVLVTALRFRARGSNYLQHYDWTVSEIRTGAGWRINAQGWALTDSTHSR